MEEGQVYYMKINLTFFDVMDGYDHESWLWKNFHKLIQKLKLVVSIIWNKDPKELRIIPSIIWESIENFHLG